MPKDRTPARPPADEGRPTGERPFVGLHMRCCNVYVRAYPTATGDAFVAHCPRCAAPVRVQVDNDAGSNDRFFAAS